ncbi:hypothetical protein PAECIP111892_04296 [Paenibacillus auburnensis]|uniref:Uncharacterized protein n=2 Tax=Paenibacillus auburnensis TaxID=2905649 RepID=A0ABN8GWF2_9BACL|nr:hypothetical protein PAECIP111892_04296 [Paenibacillus auburnensis]
MRVGGMASAEIRHCAGNRGKNPVNFGLRVGKGGNRGKNPSDFGLCVGKGRNKGKNPFDLSLRVGKGRNRGKNPIIFRNTQAIEESM